ncbi:2OG-Fe(II) oxygenase [Synechococcus sp. R5-13]|jgi:Rps23 Pro-64 3,4-dihydroxylase Tpa1-like proline 4-hydroxylase|uniref:2OG-Fe(II) oxygenase n=1 Tax=Synechococcus sp. R5-13 TaxID=2291953 RepID=UPI0039C278BB
MQRQDLAQDLALELEQTQSLTQLLDWALARLPAQQIFCQIGWEESAAILQAMLRYTEKLAVILRDPLQNSSEKPISTEDIQTQISQLGLEERVLLLEGSVPALLADLWHWFPETQIGVCFQTELTDYRTHLLRSLLLRNYLADLALYLVNHCRYGAIAQANLDLMGVDPSFHLQKILPNLGQGIHLLTWDPQHKVLTEQDLAYIQTIGPGSLLSANPVSLTFAQPDPSEPTRFYPCKYIKLDNFLPQEINQAILQHAITHQDKFVPSRSYSKNNTEAESLKFRRSLRLDFAHFQEYGALLREKIAAVAPQIFAELGIENFDIQIFEMEMIASYDSCYFVPHIDNSYLQTAFRQVSCVYYFHKEPKPYRGGELRIYDTQRRKPHPPILYGAYDEVIPTNNSIVFFLSSCLHEILPVFSHSQAFADSRFTVNTWLGSKQFT